MKKVSLFALALLALNSCKKSSSSPAPTIVGTWTISNISGTTTNQSSSGAKVITTNYAYAGNILSVTDNTSVIPVVVNNETWVFKSDGTDSIYESYQSSTATAPTIHKIAGWWDYTSSTLPNSTILLRGGGSPTVVPIGGALFIKSVTATQLVISVSGSNSVSTGATTSTDFVMTFTRQ